VASLHWFITTTISSRYGRCERTVASMKSAPFFTRMKALMPAGRRSGARSSGVKR
jgi:hypothetical protein